MSETTSLPALDAAVQAAREDLEQRGVPPADALFLLGTGLGMLGTRLESASRWPLSRTRGVPAPWSTLVLHTGRIGPLAVWILEDAPGAAEHGTQTAEGEPAWARGFPCWLAATAGVSVCVHTSAGHALVAEDGRLVRPGSLALVADHVNLSGTTPLVGLAGSRLGPLFPDVSRLHHEKLRRTALRRGKKLGVPVGEVVAACTLGPAQETLAERRFWSRAGADVAVQELATPLLACAHAGLAVLAIVAVTDTGEGLQDMVQVVAQADALAPAIEELLVEMAPDLARVAAELTVDE